jgi:hypothetical protein
MLELPRALVVEADQDFARGVADSLRSHTPEIAVKIVSSLDGALTAVEALHPHIVFLDWNVRVGDQRASLLLRKMSDLMAADPSSYDYPLLVNSHWQHEYQQDWAEQGVTFQMDNPWIVIGRSDSAERDALISRWLSRKMQSLRVVRLTKSNIDLGRSAYVRISDRPPRIHYWDVRERAELTLDRHRDDTFPLISQQIVSPLSRIESVAAARSLFVRANQRNCWVNLAYVERIAYDAAGERSFAIPGVASPPRLNVTVAHAVARMLEAMSHLGLWPHLARLEVPE